MKLPLFQPIEKIMYCIDSIQFTCMSYQAKCYANKIEKDPELKRTLFRFSTLLYGGQFNECGFEKFLEQKGIPWEYRLVLNPRKGVKNPSLIIRFPDKDIKVTINLKSFAMKVRFCFNKYINHTNHNLILRSATIDDLKPVMDEIVNSMLLLLEEYGRILANESDKRIFFQELGCWQTQEYSLNRLDLSYDIYFKEAEYKQQFLKSQSDIRLPDYVCSNMEDFSIMFMPASRQDEKSLPKIHIYDKHRDVIRYYPECEDAVKQSKNVVRFEFQFFRKAIIKKFGRLSHDAIKSKICIKDIFHEYYGGLFSSFYKTVSFNEKNILQLLRSWKYFHAFATIRDVLEAAEHLKISPATMRKHLRLLAELGLVRGNKRWNWAKLTDMGNQFTELFTDEKKDLTHEDVLSFLAKCIQANHSRKVEREQTIHNSPARLHNYDTILIDNLYDSKDIDLSRTSNCNTSIPKSSVAGSLRDEILKMVGSGPPEGTPMWEIIEKFGQKADAVITELLDKNEVYEQRPGVLKLM